MTNRKCQRFTAFLPFLAALATLVLFAGSTRVSASAPSVPPAGENGTSPAASDPAQDSTSSPEDTGTPEIFEFSSVKFTVGWVSQLPHIRSAIRHI